MKRDDDIVKALGFVALYAAYLEEGIDLVMQRLSVVKEINAVERKLPTSKKIAWCQSVLSSLNSIELDQLKKLLSDAEELLKWRNEVIHGRIYAGNERGDNLQSGRTGIPDRTVTAEELYDLAELLFSAQAVVPNINYFATLRAIAARTNA